MNVHVVKLAKANHNTLTEFVSVLLVGGAVLSPFNIAVPLAGEVIELIKLLLIRVWFVGRVLPWLKNWFQAR